MMTQTNVSSGSIGAQISSLDQTVGQLLAEVDDLSLEAVKGDKAAAKRIAEINARIDAAALDRRVLECAQAAAHRLETEAELAADRAIRDGHYNEAKRLAVELVAQADKCDALVETIMSDLASLAGMEKAIHASLRQAGEPAGDEVRGRHNVMQNIIDRLQAVTSGRSSFDKTERRAGYWSRVGWRYLLEGDDQ